jgi:non-ribosomal peptide synthetase-like protein
MLGTPTGKMVFDDGFLATERTLTAIGDYCTLNEFSILQNHSLEDGVFKSDRIKLGTGCTVGPNAFVHYGVELGDGTVVDTDAFLMKGEITARGSVWQGNPARQI